MGADPDDLAPILPYLERQKLCDTLKLVAQLPPDEACRALANLLQALERLRRAKLVGDKAAKSSGKTLRVFVPECFKEATKDMEPKVGARRRVGARVLFAATARPSKSKGARRQARRVDAAC